MSLGYISEIERGQKEASSELLASLCGALEVPLSDVLREVSFAVAIEEAASVRRAAPRSADPAAAPRSSPPPPEPAHPSARAGWQAGHQYAARSRPGSPSSAYADGRAAAQARLTRSAVDPQVAPATLVAGGADLGQVPVLVQHRARQPHHPERVGDQADRRARVVAGEEAQLGAVDRADAGEVALVEQRLAERTVGVGREPADGLLPRPSRGRAGRGRDGRRRRPRARGAPAPRPRAGSRPRPGRRRRARPGPGGRACSSARPVEDPPGALHLQVGVQGPARPSGVGVDAGEQVLAAGDGLDDGAAGQVDGGDARHPEVGAASARGPTAPVQQPGRPPDRVALGHVSRPRLAAQPARGGDEPGRVQRRPQRASRRSRAAARRRPARRSSGPARRAGRRRPALAAGSSCRALGVVGPGEQRAAAALDVERQRAVDEHHHARRPCARAGGPRPRRPRRARAGRARGARRRRGWRGRWRPGRPRPAWRRRGPRRRCAAGRSRPTVPNWAAPRPADEVAAPAAAGLLERRQHLVDGREAAGHPLADHRAAGDHAVAVEHPLGDGVGAAGRVVVERRQQRPAAGGLGGTAAAGHAGPGRTRSCGCGPAPGGCGGRCCRRGSARAAASGCRC